MGKEPAPEKIRDMWSEKIMNICLYLLFFISIYAMFIGFKMGTMLSEGKEIPDFLKSAHTHTLLIAVLLFAPIFDWRLKNIENKDRIAGKWSAIMVLLSVIGLGITATGFSLAGLFPSMIRQGIGIFHIGESIMFLAFLAYTIIAIIEEMYK